MKKKDIGLGIASIVLGIAAFLGSSTFPTGTSADTLGAAFFPRLVAVIVMILGASIIVGVLREKEDEKAAGERAASKSISYWRVTAIIALLFIYYFALTNIGYISSTFVLIMAGAYILNYKNIKVTLAVSACISVGLYLLFTKVFYIRFPGIF